VLNASGGQVLNASAVHSLTEDLVIAISSEGSMLSFRINSGKRHTTIKFSELDHYAGTRGQRGKKLPRGFQSVDSVAVEVKPGR